MGERAHMTKAREVEIDEVRVLGQHGVHIKAMTGEGPLSEAVD